jgi:peptidoglycan hydrolase-like protein with peptidoglycan-binding domain
VRQGDSGLFVQLFSAACVFNGMVHDNNGQQFVTSFKDSFDDKLGQYVRAFQEFSALPTTSIGDYQTWCQLLVSCGDPDRRATGSDTRYQITAPRAAAMRAAGYTHVGRYLANDPTSSLDKEIKPGELNDIFTAGLRMFPIWQYNARELGDFTYSSGYQHALLAHQRAVGYGFNTGTVIYFAVDYDATNDEIDSNILPYFHGVQAGLASQGHRYIAAAYGSRNVCSRLTDQAYSRYSFVSGMSYGFSGNLGFPMPDNWSFTQIKEFSFTQASTGPFDLDNDVVRPHADNGVGPENVNSTSSPLDAALHYIEELYALAVRYNKGDPSLRVLEFLRYPEYVKTYDGWGILIGDVDEDWINYALQNGIQKVSEFPDPSYGVGFDLSHFGATANATYLKGAGATGSMPNRGDFGGWGGDLCTFYGDWRNNADSYASGYAFCMDRLAKINVSSSFPFDDMLEDVDGYLIGLATRAGTPINQAMQNFYAGNGHLSRFKQFYDMRHGGSVANVKQAADDMLEGSLGDPELEVLRTTAIRKVAGWNVITPNLMPRDKLDPFLQGYADTIQALVGQENARAKR